MAFAYSRVSADSFIFIFIFVKYFSSLCFPLHFRPEWSVAKTFKDFKQHLRPTKDNNFDIVHVLLERGHMIPKDGSNNMDGHTNPLVDDARSPNVLDTV